MSTTKAEQIRRNYQGGRLREQAGAWAVVTTGHGLDLFDDDGFLLDEQWPETLSSGAQAWAALVTHLLGRTETIDIADALTRLDPQRSGVALQALTFVAEGRSAFR